jgi:hypothetical protein
VLALTLANDDVFAAQDPQTLRNRGNRFAFRSRQLADAAFTLSQPGRKAHPRRIPQSSKKAGRLVYRRLTHQ